MRPSRLESDFGDAYDARGAAEERKSEYVKAIADYNEAIRLYPTYALSYNNLAWLLAVCPDADVRNGAKAVEYAKRACMLSKWKLPIILDTLAAGLC